MTAVIVLEGHNGVGKSSLARALSTKLGVPIIRPFRNANTDQHLGHEGTGPTAINVALRSFGVPVNTFVDDFYVADFLAASKVGAILDRSMPSAIAYGFMRHEMSLGHGQKLLDLWQTMLLSAQRTLYVQLGAPKDVLKKRCEGRWFPSAKEFDRLDKAFTLCFRSIKLPKKQIVTTDAQAVDVTTKLICQLLKS